MTGILQRLVCVTTNFGLGQWGDEVFLVIARGVVGLKTAAQRALATTHRIAVGKPASNA